MYRLRTLVRGSCAPDRCAARIDCREREDIATVDVSKGPTSQLVQAMAGFGGGAVDASSTVSLGADTSQQTFLTVPRAGSGDSERFSPTQRTARSRHAARAGKTMAGIKRRDVVTLLGGAAVAWPLVARGQSTTERVRRIGVLMSTTADDPEGQARIAALHQGLQEWGWTLGRNARIDVRWGAFDADSSRHYATELVALAPEVIVAFASAAMGALQQMRTVVPIVFVSIIDPVGAGFVKSLARPGGNVTGFSLFEYGLSGKWLELLKEIAPSVTRAAVLRDAAIASGVGQYAIIQALAPSLGIELHPIDVHDPGEIERGVLAFAREPNCGLIIVGAPSGVVHRDLIIALAARHRLPAVYPTRISLTAAAWSPTALMSFLRSDAPPAMSTVSSRARSRLIFRCRRRRNTSW